MLLYNVYDNQFFYENKEENIISISTSNGHFTVDISEFFPVTKKKMSMLLDIIREDWHGEKIHVEKLAAFLSGAVDHLARLEKNEQDARTKASYTAKLKKWHACYTLLAERYNLEEKEKSAEMVKYKKIDCYPFAKWDNEYTPRRMDGWKFEKYGLALYVYKNDRGGNYNVIVPCLGLSCCNDTSKAAAVAALTEELAEKVKETLRGNTKESRQRYVDYLAAAGLENVLEDPFYDMPIFEAEKPEAKQEEATAPEVTEKEEAKEAPRFTLEYLKTLNYQFNTIYCHLYDNDNTPEDGTKQDYYSALCYFDDSMTAAEKDILTAFCDYRRDYVASDREAAAFILALWKTGQPEAEKSRAALPVSALKMRRDYLLALFANTPQKTARSAGSIPAYKNTPDRFKRNTGQHKSQNRHIIPAGSVSAGIAPPGLWTAGQSPFIDNMLSSAAHNAVESKSGGRAWRYIPSRRKRRTAAAIRREKGKGQRHYMPAGKGKRGHIAAGDSH